MATDIGTSRDQYEAYRFCYENGHQQWLQKATRCFDFWSGQQWDPFVKAQLEREGRPALTLNVIESLVRAMEGMQRALRNDVRFLPADKATSQSARVQDAVWMHIQQRNQFDFLEAETFKKGLIMGRAYLDVRMQHDDNMLAHALIRGRRSQDVVLDPSIETYDTTDWPQVFTRRWVSYDDIRNKYGKDKAEAVGFSDTPTWYDFEDKIVAQQMGLLPYYHNGMINIADQKKIRGLLATERQYYVEKRKRVFMDTDNGEWSEIPEKWDRERVGKVLATVPGLTTTMREIRTVRWTVTCEDVVLHDEDSPMKYFSIVPYFPTFLDGFTMGAVESLLDPQELYNKMTSSELHIISTTANSGYKVKTGSLKNMTAEELEEKGSKTGFVAELDNVEDLEKIQPNQVPAGHDRLSFKADQIMRQLAGTPNGARGFARDDASGDKVMEDQAAADVNVAPWLSNLHRTKQLVARNVQDVVQAHYTETRLIQINRGTAFVPRVEEMTINQPMTNPENGEAMLLNDVTQGAYTTIMVPSPMRTRLSSEDFKLLLQLRTEVGIAIPDDMLLELSPASNRGEIIEAISGGPSSVERQQQAEDLAAQQQAAENAKSEADAANKNANASLAMARAEKFAIEAASDPDASYERVETKRLENERQMHDDKINLDAKKADDTRKFQREQIAVRLAELELERESADADREVAKQEARSVARRDKKPAATKSK